MFDFRKAFVDHRRAAKNVQCIFTSRDKGSRHTTACHQNWKMGNCGWSQVAAQDPPLGSHGLCPYFYLSAFSNDFPAVRKPAECGSRRMAGSWPVGFKMGYTESRKSWVAWNWSSSLIYPLFRFICGFCRIADKSLESCSLWQPDTTRTTGTHPATTHRTTSRSRGWWAGTLTGTTTLSRIIFLGRGEIPFCRITSWPAGSRWPIESPLYNYLFRGEEEYVNVVKVKKWRDDWNVSFIN